MQKPGAQAANIFSFLWFIWAALGLLFTLLIAYPSYHLAFAFSGKGRKSFAYTITYLWAQVLMQLYLIRVKVYARKILDRNEAYVFISNHRSQLDIPVCALAAGPHPFKFLAKAELSRIPLLGKIISNLYILVNRGTKTGSARSMVHMAQALNEGISVFIFPEGTRNQGPRVLLGFQDGAFRLAIKAQKPIAVLVIAGAGERFPAGQMKSITPGYVYARWLPPIPTAGLTNTDIPRLKEQVQQLMKTELLKYPSKRYYQP
ncbi:MAG: lysophospholipid acyltransferase family protein [Bacteroidia bacterium]